jgi:hypothetical protein
MNGGLLELPSDRLGSDREAVVGGRETNALSLRTVHAAPGAIVYHV